MSVPTRAPEFVTQLVFPATITNRPSLPRIGYRIGTYSDVRTALFRALDLDPNLAAWTHRDADDPGIALLEGAAILVDILTFYQELYANEAFLRTATWRDSVVDLVKLLGYRVSPGVGGNATFAFDVRGDAAVTVPAGFPVKADLAPLTSSADFETVGPAPATVYPWLGKINLYAPQQAVSFAAGVTDLVVTAGDAGLTFKPGDRLLVGSLDASSGQLTGAGGGDAELVVVGSVRQLHGQNVLTLKAPLPAFDGDTTSLSVFRLGRSFNHFGYNAPKQDVVIVNATTDSNGVVTSPAHPVASDVDYFRLLQDITDSSTNATTTVFPDLATTLFPLDSVIDNLVKGAPIVVQLVDLWKNPLEIDHYSVVATIADVKVGGMSWGGLSGMATFVTIDHAVTIVPLSDDGDGNDPLYNTSIKNLRLLEVTSPQLTVMALPAADTTSNDWLLFEGTADEVAVLPFQRLYLATQPNQDPEIATVLQYLPAGNDPLSNPNLFPLQLQTRAGIDYDLYPYEAPSNGPPLLTVLGNLVDATQGKTEKLATLGNGDAGQTFQTFKLPKAPLTYLLPDGAARPGVVQATVRVGGVEWQNVDSLYGHGPDEEIYVVRQDQDNNSYVQFGDGQTGARLPSGVGNVTALFRTGIGAFGPVKTGATPSPGARLDAIRALALAGDATGGAAAEGADQARLAAPGQVQSMGRIVSLQDFETEAIGIPGVGLVAARWDLDPASGVPAVLVTMLMLNGGLTEFSAAQSALEEASHCRGADRFPVVVSEGFYAYVALVVNVAIDPNLDWDTLLPTIKAALGVDGEEAGGVDGSQGLFALARRRFGGAEYTSRIEATIQNVAGVVWCEVQAAALFADSATVNDPTTLAMPAPSVLAALATTTLSCAADHVLRLYSVPGANNPLQLVQAPPPPHVECAGE